MAGWVYIISNKAMPNILKIGYTERTPYIRAYELYNTGCPYPYKVDYAIYVDRPYEVEQKAHELQRANNVGKEWFSCSFEEAVSTINQSVKLIGAIIENNKKPPVLTPEEISEVIRNNPVVEKIIYTSSQLSITIDNQLLTFHTVDYKIKFEKELSKVNTEFSEKIASLRKEHQDILTKKMHIKSLGDYMTEYLFVGFFIFLIFGSYTIDCIAHIFGLYGSKKDTIYAGYFFIYIISAITLAICMSQKSKQKRDEYKKIPFNSLFKGRIEKYEKEREYNILNLKNKFKDYYGVIKLD